MSYIAKVREKLAHGPFHYISYVQKINDKYESLKNFWCRIRSQSACPSPSPPTLNGIPNSPTPLVTLGLPGTRHFDLDH